MLVYFLFNTNLTIETLHTIGFLKLKQPSTKVFTSAARLVSSSQKFPHKFYFYLLTMVVFV